MSHPALTNWRTAVLRSIVVFTLAIGWTLNANAQQNLQQKFATFQQSFTKASEHFKAKEFQECSTELDKSKKLLSELVTAAENPRQRSQLKPQYERLLQAEVALKKNGVELQDSPTWAEFLKSALEKPDAMKPVEANTLSFSRDIVPILNQRCGNCHIRRASGQLSMATYESMLQGAKGVPLITPGNAAASRMIEVIEDGDMPRGGQKLTEQELVSLKQWLDAGAPFDGTSPKDPITASVATAAPAPAMDDNFVAPAKTTVSFARDIAPVLVENCKGCHVEATQLRGGLNMNSFAQLIRGGDSGNVLVRGKGKESLIVRKLRGMEGQRMPVNRPALDGDTIAKFETWIDEGASFDGPSPETAVARVAELAWVANASPDELKEKRLAVAKDAWLRVYGKANEFSANNEIFVVLSDDSAGTAKKVLDLATEISSQLQGTLKLKAGVDLFPGGATIFTFNKRYDYSEFGKMAESRSLPATWSAHWRRDGVNAYVAIQAGSQDAEQLENNLKINLAALWASSFKGMPRWFADGIGRYVYSTKTGRNDANVVAWEQTAQRAVLSMKDAQPLLQNSMNEEDSAAIGFVLVKALNQGPNKKKFDAFLKRMQAADDFQGAFTESYGPLEASVAGFLGFQVK